VLGVGLASPPHPDMEKRLIEKTTIRIRKNKYRGNLDINPSWGGVLDSHCCADPPALEIKSPTRRFIGVGILGFSVERAAIDRLVSAHPFKSGEPCARKHERIYFVFLRYFRIQGSRFQRPHRCAASGPYRVCVREVCLCSRANELLCRECAGIKDGLDRTYLSVLNLVPGAERSSHRGCDELVEQAKRRALTIVGLICVVGSN